MTATGGNSISGERRVILGTVGLALILLSSGLVVLGTNIVSADQAISLPGVPTGVNADAGPNQVSLSWNAPASDGGGAIDYYVIQRQMVASMDGGPFYPTTSVNETILRVGVELPENTNAFTAVIKGLDSLGWSLDFSYAYNFTIAAHNAAGTGPQCGAIQANSYAIIPIVIVDTWSGDRQVAIQWEMAHEYRRPGTPILYFVIDADGVDVMHTSASSDYRATVTGLTNGHTYNFSVAEHTAWGDLGRNNQTATPMATPDAPTGLSATVGNGRVLLKWNAPDNAGESFIESYNVYQDGVHVAGNISTSIDITGLTNNHTYSFSVAAYNSLNHGTEGSRSSVIQATPIPETSSPPTGLTGVPGNGKVDLSWSTPDNNGGGPIDYFVVYQDGIDVKHVAGNSGTISGLMNNRSYSFAVGAHNYVGTGSKSGAILATPYTAPDAPTGLAGALGNGQITLNWTAPAFDGGRDIDYYILYQDGVALPYYLTGPSTIINGLINGRTYSFAVSAHNLAGIGVLSVATSTSPSPAPTVPGTPSGLVAIPKNAEVSLSWKAPTRNGSSAIDYYIVYQDGIDITHSATNSTTISGLVNGHLYTFTVAAHNSAGTGAIASNVSATPFSLNAGPTIPDAPTGLTVTPGNSQVSLSWSAPTNDGGSAVDYYLVYINGDVRTDHYFTTSTIIKGLTNGQQYGFEVAAHNAVGASAPSSQITAIPSTLKSVPEAPMQLTATAGNAQITLSWAAPSNNGGALVEYYIVYQNGIDISHPTSPTKTINGLSNGYPYNFTVAAHNSVGTGAQTPTVSAKPGVAVPVPDVPNDLIVSIGDGQVTLSWTAPSNSPGIDYYIIYQNGVDILHSNVNSTVISGLTDGKVYSFSVAAHNLGGVGTRSSAQNISPGASGSTATTISFANMDLIIYSGILALLAIVIVAIFFAVKRRGNRK